MVSLRSAQINECKGGKDKKGSDQDHQQDNRILHTRAVRSRVGGAPWGGKELATRGSSWFTSTKSGRARST